MEAGTKEEKKEYDGVKTVSDETNEINSIKSGPFTSKKEKNIKQKKKKILDIIYYK
jgi:hypothetical protein